MAQVQAGQNLWQAPWAALHQPCSLEDDLVYIQVNLSLVDIDGRCKQEIRKSSLYRHLAAALVAPVLSSVDAE